MSNERKRRVVPWVVGVVMGLYVGAYYATVWAVHPHWNGTGELIPYYTLPGSVDKSTERERWIRIDGICQYAFFPIHRIDRRFRPYLWKDHAR